MAKLSKIEARIIQSLLTKQYGPKPPFLDQLAAATVTNRRMTGVGCFIDLKTPKDIPAVDHINAEASDGFDTRLPPPCDLVEFTLFIRDGYLDWLEGYTFGDVRWPNQPIEEWLLFDAD